MKIAQKLGLLVGALLAAVLVAILVLSAQLATTSKEYNSLINNEIRQREAARSMNIAFDKQVLQFQQILLNANTNAEYTTALQTYNVQLKTVDTLTDQLLANTGKNDPRLQTSLKQFRTSHGAVSIQFQAALEAFKASGFRNISAASDAVQGLEIFPNSLVSVIVDYRQKSVDALIKSQSDSVSQRLKLIYAVSFLLLLGAGLAVTAVVRGIVGPVRSLTNAALDAANERLPRVVAEIGSLPADAPTPSLPRFEVTTKDELSELASALTTLQNSAVDLALEQRRNEEANAETLVNLGRRNQSLMTRMLSYVTELERDERDSEALDKLFRLDHLTTRIRRNAESLLVLAGAKQTRTWSQPIAIDDVLSAALSEIEEYTRVTVHHMDHAKVHGTVAADLTHMVAELLENGTRFSPTERQVLVVGRLTPSGYQFDLIDAGLGMEPEEIEAANMRIAQAGQRRPDTKVLGHHVVGRIASRRGIFVQLLPSDQVGLTATVLVPVGLLSDAQIPATFQDITVVPPISSIPMPPPPPQPALASSQQQRPQSRPVQPQPGPVPNSYPQPNYPPPNYPAPNAPGSAPQRPLRLPASAPVPHLTPVGSNRAVPGRRVRGAQLGDLAGTDRQPAAAPVDANLVRSQMSALQSGVSAARKEQGSQPIPQNPNQNQNQQRQIQHPPTGSVELPKVPTRRVRGAQLAELGADDGVEAAVPVRDPAAIGRQLSGLQAARTRAMQETGRYHTNDEDNGSNR
jgi:hypothetical protein